MSAHMGFHPNDDDPRPGDSGAQERLAEVRKIVALAESPEATAWTAPALWARVEEIKRAVW